MTALNEPPAGYAELLRILANLPLLVLEKRRRLGLSQRAAADQTGLTFSTICRAEQGYDMRLSTAMELLEWVGRSDIPPAPPAPPRGSSLMPDLLSLNPRTTDLINLTPHAIRLYHHTAPDTLDNDWDFLVLTVDPSGRTARLAERSVALRHTAMESYTQGDVSIPVESVEYGQVVGLPEEQSGVLLIVPPVTALAVLATGGRDDLLVPWRQVRNVSGTVIGCRAFAHPFTAVSSPSPTERTTS